MTNELILKSFCDIPAILNEVSAIIGKDDGFQIWWRGQADASWLLQPSSARHYGDQRHEYGANRYFQQKAGSRRTSVPPRDDNIAWLSLMQHYGHPTRLLDWSESLMVGLFFAVCGTSPEQLDKDGALYALNPARLNEFFLKLERIAHPMHPEIQSTAGAAFGVIPPANIRAAAFAPEEFDPRMLSQQTMFTIHGGWPIHPLENAGGQTFLQKIVIPATAKPDLVKILFQLGMRSSSLFPDIQSLSGEIKRLTFK